MTQACSCSAPMGYHTRTCASRASTNHLGNRIDRDQQHASWPTEQEARAIAQANQADDPDWTYDVAMRPDYRYVVVVIDENGNLLGFL